MTQFWKDVSDLVLASKLLTTEVKKRLALCHQTGS